MTLHMISDVSVPEHFELPERPGQAQRQRDAQLFDQAVELIRQQEVFLIAHYYTSDTMQRLAEATGGFIGDSLEMARAGHDSPYSRVAVAGVRFMGETAKILSPAKQIIMPNLGAECSLDLCCAASELRRVRERLPQAVLVAYANTSAEVKAMADWIVTSSLAVELAAYLKERGETILWVPDRNLGAYIAHRSPGDIYCWPGRCIVHDAFLGNALAFMKQAHPAAQVLVHPEAPQDVIAQADFTGSTSQILNFVKASAAEEFIIATERNIFYKISQACPGKTLIPAPSAGDQGQCVSCANCPWMELNTVAALMEAIVNPQGHAIEVDPQLCALARRPLQRMLRFAACLKGGAPLPADL